MLRRFIATGYDGPMHHDSRQVETALRVSTLLAAVISAACFGNETTEFPPGLEPVEENSAPLPEPTATDMYPEIIETVHGRTDGVMFSHSHAYVHANPAKVWLAIKDVDVVSDRRNADRRTSSPSTASWFTTKSTTSSRLSGMRIGAMAR